MHMSRVRSVGARRRIMLIALALALIASLGMAGAAWADDSEPQPSIFGFVTDSITGEPIAGAEVMLLLGQPWATPGPPGPVGPDAWRVTDENGYYEYFDLEPFDDRHYTVIAGADLCEGASSENFVYAGEGPVQMDLALVSQAGAPSVTGMVTDAVTGLVVPQATVWLWYDDGENIPARAVDEDGTFAFWGIGANREFQVGAEVFDSDYDVAFSAALIYDGENPIEVTITLTRQLQARGIDFAGRFIDDYDPGLTDIAGLSQDAQSAIRALAFYGVTVGHSDGTYKPSDEVTRSQMALFLARVIQYAIAGGATQAPDQIADPGFQDTSALSHEAKAAIALLHALGVAQGTTATTFDPHAYVTRYQMATFMVRLQNLLGQDSYATDQWFFSDVPDTLPRAADINALAAKRIAVGYGDGTYGPFDSVLRSQMALFIMRQMDENVEAGRLPALEAPSN